VIDLTPIGPEVPSPSRARRKISLTVSAWTGSISKVFFGIVAELLRDRHQPHAVLGKSPDVEVELELVSKEAAEAVDDDDIEHRRLSGSDVDHALEFRPSVVGRRHAGLDVVRHDLPAT
jgi:hypothetical protein